MLVTISEHNPEYKYRCKVTDASGNIVYSKPGTIKTAQVDWKNTYNSEGVRVKRSDGYTSYNYVYNGNKLSQMTVGDETLRFGYSESGVPIYVQWNNSRYFYVTNQQGDVTAIVSISGIAVVKYNYDAWENILSITGSRAENLGKYNPLRYRGYICYQETGFYYLQSRYYDPEIGRFISPDTTDVLTATPMGLTDKNLYAYCDNNPVMRKDDGGYLWDTVFDVVSLCVSIVDVINDPTDVGNWLGLVGDAVDLIPFVTGVGEVTRAVNFSRKALDAADDIHDAAKVAKKAPIVIGENMKRVRKYAKEIGGEVYKPWKNDPFDFDLAMKRNKRWINDKMKEGREIIDIGPDFARRRTGYGASPFYEMERTQLNGYSNYKKVFTRFGQYGGIFNEW